MTRKTESIFYTQDGARTAQGDPLKAQYYYQRTSGFPQGSPVNPMLFCLALRGALATLESSLQRLDPRARVVAYLDDIHVLIEPQHMMQALELATNILGEALLILNPAKCEVWAPNPALLDPCSHVFGKWSLRSCASMRRPHQC